MLHNYLLVALRNLRRNRGYAAINVFGLAVGIACCLLIALFLRSELSYERHHEQADRLLRVNTQFGEMVVPVTANIVGPMLRREMPQLEETVRLFDLGTFESVAVRYGDRMFEEDRFFYADSTVFDVFTLPLVSGDPATALTRPHTVVLTAESAQRYFGDADALGETLHVGPSEFEVTGVLAPLPTTSHIQFDFLGSFATLGWSRNEIWSSANFFTYLLVRPDASTADVQAQIERLLADARAEGHIPQEAGLQLEPLTSIYLDGSGRRVYVYLFGIIAALILLVACVNNINLVTARATRRGREVGVRKVLGARRPELMGQFFGESSILAFASVALAAFLAVLFAPMFSAISGTALALSLLDPFVLTLQVLIGLLVALVAGSYPALLLSSFQPADALRNSLRSGRGSARFRRTLVVFQFAVSVFLLVGTAVVWGQLRYVQTAELGFRGEQVMALPAGDRATQDALPAIKQRLLAQPGVVATAAIDRLPGMSPGGYSLMAEGFEVPPGMDYYPMSAIPAEPGIADALGIELIAGADFRERHLDAVPGELAYLVNEATLGVLGWTPHESIGRRFSVSGNNRWGTIVGVFRDYHFLPLREPVGPLAFFVEPSSTNNLLVRVSPEHLTSTLPAIEAIWREHVAHRPFTYTFLDQAFSAHYESERQLGRLFGAFALLALLIACLGLLGLAAYAAEQRSKEIGIRKVLGARSRHVVVLLSREFATLVVLGFALGAPLAYVVMSRWLEGFAYRMELGVGLFALAGLAALVLALATVSGQALRAATADPVLALRRE